MKHYNVYIKLDTGIEYIGTYEANSREDAVKAWATRACADPQHFDFINSEYFGMKVWAEINEGI